MKHSHLEKVAAVAFMLGGEEEGLRKTAGIFTSFKRLFRRPGALFGKGGAASKKVQDTLASGIAQTAQKAVDPNKNFITRGWNRFRSGAKMKSLAEEKAFHNSILAKNQRRLQRDIDLLNTAQQTIGVAPGKKGLMSIQQQKLQKQLDGVTAKMSENQAAIGSATPKGAGRAAGQTAGNTASGGTGLGVNGSGGTLLSGQNTAAPGNQANPSALGAAFGAAQAGAHPKLKPVNMPSFFNKYDPSSLTRRIGEYAYADPMRAAAIGLGGAWGLNSIVSPTVSNVLGTND